MNYQYFQMHKSDYKFGFKNYFWVFILYPWITLAQNPLIEIKIDTIQTTASDSKERTFTVKFYIKNLTNRSLSFFLNPNQLIPNSRASLSRKISYSLFQEQELIDIDGVFGNRFSATYLEQIKNAPSNAEKEQIISEYLKNITYKNKPTQTTAEDIDLAPKYLEEAIESSIFNLKPNEKACFSKELIWDKTRYFKLDENEFYLDEKTPHFIQLTLNLMKEEFKDQLNPERYQEIAKNPDFIKGWFTSNKMEINFKE